LFGVASKITVWGRCAVADGGLRLVQGVLPGVAGARPDPQAYQAACIEAWAASQVARNFSPATIDKAIGILERILELCGRPAWEVTHQDLDRVVGAFASAGLSASTRRGYVSVFKGFFRFLAARKQPEIQAWFGVRLADPVDEFNAARHVGSDSPGVAPPPTPERMDAFFGFLRERLATCRKFAPAGRDYALVRTLYHAGLRAEEAVSLDLGDVHFTRGPFGKLHVRYGKAARGSGPRPRWVPMLDQLDLVLRWYVNDVRPRFGGGSALFCDEGGGRMHKGSVRNRLAHLLKLEGRPAAEGFTPHGLRHACATRNYERGVDLVAIQQLLGHWHIGTTMRYVTPSATFIEDAYRRALSEVLGELDPPPDGQDPAAGQGPSGRPGWT
jgi:integrase/recombinase XerD